MRTGTVGTSAICAARQCRAPATISKPFSVRGRTSRGERTPWVADGLGQFLQSDFIKDTARVGLGLTHQRESETLRYSMALTICVSMMCSFRTVEGEKLRSGDVLSVPLRESGLATNALVLEGFHESLRIQVVVPQRSEPRMLAVEHGVKRILSGADEARPLLNSGVIVAVVE